MRQQLEKSSGIPQFSLAGPGRVTGYNGAALNSRWDCILSVVLRGTDASNLVAQGIRRLPHANRSGRRLARAGILTGFYL
jgi:hypothetical protein